MILLKELKLNNFLSHEDTVISFNDNEKILLDGRSGSGKSSISEAIVWALYGKGRSENRFLVRRGSKTKKATISIKLTDGTVETNITRTVSGGKNTLSVVQNNGTKGQFISIKRSGLKDTQDWIEKEFLKASYELFTNSIAYPQENENSFVKANAARRKDLLLEIIQAGNFDELYTKARNAINVNELDSVAIVTEHGNLEEALKGEKEIAKNYDSYKLQIEKLTLNLQKNASVEKETENKLKDLSQFGLKIKDKKSIEEKLLDSIKFIKDQLSKDEEQLVRYSSYKIESFKEEMEELDLLLVELEITEKEIKDYTTSQSRINAHLSNRPSVFDYSKDIEIINNKLIPLIQDSGKCPAGNNCPFVVPIKGQIDFLTEQITEKTEKSINEKNELKEWENKYADLITTTDINDLYKKLKELNSKIEKLSEIRRNIDLCKAFEREVKPDILERNPKLLKKRTTDETELSSIRKEIIELKTELNNSDINKLTIKLSETRILIKQEQTQKEDLIAHITMAERSKENIITIVKKLTVLKKDVKKLQDKKESLELIKEALSPRGIKAVVIDWMVPQLEEKINAVLIQMSDFKIRLDTQKEKANDDGNKEGLFITVINEMNEELSFDSYSGGEKVKITIAISEALASLMSSIGFRIMDENIISLDRESTEGFVEVLTKLQEKFPQLIVISHLQEVKDIFEKKVEIIKVNGISKII